MRVPHVHAWIYNGCKINSKSNFIPAKRHNKNWIAFSSEPTASAIVLRNDVSAMA